MNRLLAIGFQQCGHWFFDNNELNFKLIQHSSQKNILYAFICDGQVKYVGKTTQQLSKRMAGYKNPAVSQSTNIRNSKCIRELLKTGVAVDIMALPDNGLMHYGQFHINLAAALEDDIILKIAPEWNGGKSEQTVSTNESVPPVSMEIPNCIPKSIETSFQFDLQPTYYKSGFFNVRVSDEKLIGSDGSNIEIFLGDTENFILGTINRRCNTNHTPRIMGGTGLRDWFVKNAEIGTKITVGVLSPCAISLTI